MHLVHTLLLVTAMAATAADLRITGGAADNQVFQRDEKNRADLALRGEGPAGQSVEVRVTRKRGVVPGFEWSPFAKVAGNAWSGILTGLPVGGPYTIELRAGAARAAVHDVLVGDLWVLAGQSNMQGVGDLIDVEPPHELVHNFDMSDQWVLAEEPLHTLANAVDRVHWPRNQNKEPEKMSGDRLRAFLANRKKGAGLGLPFAVEMVKRTGVPVGLLSCAHGGTSMDQWDPRKKDQGGDSLYGSTYRRIQAAGGKVTGVLWYQGESDTGPGSSGLYQEKFERLIAAFRSDLNAPALPFYFVQLGRHVNYSNQPGWNQVQEAERLVESKVPHTGMAPAIDLELDDGIHIGTQGLKILGQRLAKLATGQAQRGPRPLSAKYSAGVIRVRFTSVNGRLRSPGRMAGFSINDAQGQPVAAIYKTRVDPADGSAILLHVGFGPAGPPSGATLWYGQGKDPYCNIVDSEDMAMPVFGPLPIE